MDALAYLVGAYFHQDWDLAGGTIADAVTEFMGESVELRTACANQIDDLVHRSISEGELRKQLVAWGCDYRAGDTDDDYRRWLVEVRDQIRAATPA